MNNKNELKCNKCNKTFKTEKSYNSHLKLRCPHCNKCNLTITKLNRHLRSHKPKKNYKCEICGWDEGYRMKNGKKIADKQKYDRHMKTHNKKESKIEEFDNYKIETQPSGIRYKITKNGSKNMLCKYDDKCPTN